MRSWLFPWRREAEPKKLCFIMYTRANCHLCQEAWSQLQDAQKRHHFRLTTIDVDSDADLAARYGNCVPVVEVDGKVRFRGRLNPVLLARLLRNS